MISFQYIAQCYCKAFKKHSYAVSLMQNIGFEIFLLDIIIQISNIN